MTFRQGRKLIKDINTKNYTSKFTQPLPGAPGYRDRVCACAFEPVCALPMGMWYAHAWYVCVCKGAGLLIQMLSALNTIIYALTRLCFLQILS